MSALKALDKEKDKTYELTKNNIILKVEINEYKTKYGELDLQAKKRLDSQKKSILTIVVSGDGSNKLLKRLIEGGKELTRSRQQYGK